MVAGLRFSSSVPMRGSRTVRKGFHGLEPNTFGIGASSISYGRPCWNDGLFDAILADTRYIYFEYVSYSTLLVDMLCQNGSYSVCRAWLGYVACECK